MRLIDADEFIKEMNNRCEEAIKWGINAIADHNEEIKIRAEQAVATFCEASLTAKKLPTIDAEPVRHGHFIFTHKPNIYGGITIKCSECGYEGVIAHIEDHHYCWVCGAKMDMEEE